MFSGIIYKYTYEVLMRIQSDNEDDLVKTLIKIEVQPSKAQKQVVCQYTLGGDLIREFPCINDAASVCCLNRNQFKLYLDGKNSYIYNNYIWRRKYE